MARGRCVRHLRRLEGRSCPQGLYCPRLISVQFQWVANLSANSPDYKSTTVSGFYSIWDKLYSQNGGPYVLGDQVTYADFAVFQALDNDEAVGAAPVR